MEKSQSLAKNQALKDGAQSITIKTVDEVLFYVPRNATRVKLKVVSDLK